MGEQRSFCSVAGVAFLRKEEEVHKEIPRVILKDHTHTHQLEKGCENKKISSMQNLPELP